MWYKHNAALGITGVKLGHMKNALVGVLTINSMQHPRVHSSYDLVSQRSSYEPCREKTGFLHMRKQRRRPASR